MTKKKIELNSFYQALLDVKAGLTPDPIKIKVEQQTEKPPIITTKGSPLENYLFSNLRFWVMCAINDYIVGTPLEDNSYDGINEPSRRDDQVIADVKYDKGISLIGFIGAVANLNIRENKLYEEALQYNDKPMEVLENITMSILNEVVEELFDEYEFDTELLIESYNGEIEDDE